jgi:hypothetical protein
MKHRHEFERYVEARIRVLLEPHQLGSARSGGA